MPRLPGMSVTLRRGTGTDTYLVKLDHWETLKNSLDHDEKGWIELQSVWGDGLIMVRIEDIADLFFCGQSYCDEREQYERQEALENPSR